MVFSNRTTIPTRIGKAATALMAGVALVATPIANAEPREWDIEAYDECMNTAPRDLYSCCWNSGGIIVTEDGKDKCAAPPALESDSGQTVAPPVLENPPSQNVFPPVIIAPRGPNSGTYAAH